MRVIWQREFSALLEKRLSKKELYRYGASFQTPPSSWEQMRRASDIQLLLFLKAINCQCLDDFTDLRDETLLMAQQVLGDVKLVVAYKKSHASPEYRAGLSRIARKYTRKRKCHINLRAAVCYCSEHSH